MNNKNKDDDIKMYYNLWLEGQTSYAFQNYYNLPMTFPYEYIKIKKQDIQMTENKNTMKRLINIAKKIDRIDDNYTNIYLYSNKCGNGKTMWATIIAHNYVAKTGNRAFFVKDEELHRLSTQLNSFNNADTEFTLNALIDVPLLVIDDIGTLELNKSASMLYHTLIDKRMIAKKPIIYTSNQDEQGLIYQMTTKLTSRIWNSSYKIEFFAGDVRTIIMSNNPFED